MATKIIKLQNSSYTLLPISDATAIQMMVDGEVKSVQDVILENEEVVASALNDLNDRIEDIETSDVMTVVPDYLTSLASIHAPHSDDQVLKALPSETNNAYIVLDSGQNGKVGFRSGNNLSLAYEPNAYIFINHTNVGTGTSKSVPAPTGTVTFGTSKVITGMTYYTDAAGHLSKIEVTGGTLPTANDEKTKYYAKTDNVDYPILFAYNQNQQSGQTNFVAYDSDGKTNGYYNPSKNLLYVKYAYSTEFTEGGTKLSNKYLAKADAETTYVKKSLLTSYINALDSATSIAGQFVVGATLITNGGAKKLKLTYATPPNTDEKVKYYGKAESKNYPILFGYTNEPESNKADFVSYSDKPSNAYINPSTGTLYTKYAYSTEFTEDGKKLSNKYLLQTTAETTYLKKSEFTNYAASGMKYMGSTSAAPTNVTSSGYVYYVSQDITTGLGTGVKAEKGDFIVSYKDGLNITWSVWDKNLEMAAYFGTNTPTRGDIVIANNTSGEVKTMSISELGLLTDHSKDFGIVKTSNSISTYTAPPTSTITLNADATKDTLNIHSYNTWIRLSGAGTAGAGTVDNDFVYIGHVLANNTVTSVTGTGLTFGGTLKTVSYSFDAAGHRSGTIVTSYSIPNQSKDFGKVTTANNISTYTAPATSAASAIADAVKDELKLTGANAWIRLGTTTTAAEGTADADNVTIGHVLANNPVTTASGGTLTHGGTIKIPSYLFDAAGHRSGTMITTYTLPSVPTVTVSATGTGHYVGYIKGNSNHTVTYYMTDIDAAYVNITYDGETKSVTDAILENEEVTAAALNDLNIRLLDLESDLENIDVDVPENLIYVGGTSSTGTTAVSSVGTAYIHHKSGDSSNSKIGIAGDGTWTGVTYTPVNSFIKVAHTGPSVSAVGVGPLASKTLGTGGSFAVPRIGIDTRGHVTIAASYTYTLPTTNQVLVTGTSTNSNYPLVFQYNTSAASTSGTLQGLRADTEIGGAYYNPSTNTLWATKSYTTAPDATDNSGRVPTTEWVKARIEENELVTAEALLDLNSRISNYTISTINMDGIHANNVDGGTLNLRMPAVSYTLGVVGNHGVIAGVGQNTRNGTSGNITTVGVETGTVFSYDSTSNRRSSTVLRYETPQINIILPKYQDSGFMGTMVNKYPTNTATENRNKVYYTPRTRSNQKSLIANDGTVSYAYLINGNNYLDTYNGANEMYYYVDGKMRNYITAYSRLDYDYANVKEVDSNMIMTWGVLGSVSNSALTLAKDYISFNSVANAHDMQGAQTNMYYTTLRKEGLQTQDVKIRSNGMTALSSIDIYYSYIKMRSAMAGAPLIIDINDSSATFNYSVYATKFYETSDKRVKNNITQLTYSPNDINIYSFIKNDYNTYSYGFIAQDVAKTHPELVSYSNDTSYMSVDYDSTLSLLLAKALNKIDVLETRVTELENLLNNK